jgi:tRNA threonylcarbamoyladenosine biosynthesis protein TsaB
MALDVPVVTVSSLQALALEAPEDDAAILSVIDARMGEIYVAAWHREDDGSVTLIDRERVDTAAALVLPEAVAWHVVGTGWATYEAILRERITAPIRSADGARFPQARHVAEVAARAFRDGEAVAPELALPVYLRDKVALTLVEQGRA